MYDVDIQIFMAKPGMPIRQKKYFERRKHRLKVLVKFINGNISTK